MFLKTRRFPNKNGMPKYDISTGDGVDFEKKTNVNSMPYARTKVSQKIPPLKDLKNVTFHLGAVHCEATADQYSEKVLSTKTQRELIGRWSS